MRKTNYPTPKDSEYSFSHFRSFRDQMESYMKLELRDVEQDKTQILDTENLNTPAADLSDGCKLISWAEISRFCRCQVSNSCIPCTITACQITRK
jgi:hypothetical protein